MGYAPWSNYNTGQWTVCRKLAYAILLTSRLISHPDGGHYLSLGSDERFSSRFRFFLNFISNVFLPLYAVDDHACGE